MKIAYPTILLLTTSLLLSCNDETEVDPVKERVVLPLRLEMDDYKRHFTFDADNRIKAVKNESYMPGEVVLETNIEYAYTTDRKLASSATDQGYRLVYHYEAGRIVRTDEFLNEQLSQYYTFLYDEEGRLKEYTTWQDIPEYGGVVAKAKELYVYDSHDNLSLTFLYIYNPGTKAHDLLSSFEFSDYDHYPEAEGRFDAQAFNPNAVFRKNNPGKMITRNRLGNVGMVSTYTYVYDSRGYATEKTTNVTYPYNGTSGSYKTYFYYQER